MSVIALLILSMIVGWLATLTLQSHKPDVLVGDFLIAVTGAALSAALLAPCVGISMIGASGVTLAGVGLMFAGALALLAAVNWLRSVRVSSSPRRSLSGQ
jgi:uncharacterized membrane protein YeaQ/YmgE (transglycosylase-associated protein family)